MASAQSVLGSDNVTGGLILHWFLLKAISNVKDRIRGYIGGKN